MIDENSDFADRYLAMVTGYFGAEEVVREQAQRFGREALTLGVEGLAAVHHATLRKLLAQAATLDARDQLLAAAGEVYGEVLTVFEMMLRGYQETNALLKVEIIDHQRLEKLLADRVSKLKDAIAEAKTLRGLLPICMYCKKIRDDQERWNQIEAYVAKHSHAQFSHGICPACWKAVVEPEIEKMREAVAKQT